MRQNSNQENNFLSFCHPQQFGSNIPQQRLYSQGQIGQINSIQQISIDQPYNQINPQKTQYNSKSNMQLRNIDQKQVYSDYSDQTQQLKEQEVISRQEENQQHISTTFCQNRILDTNQQQQHHSKQQVWNLMDDNEAQLMKFEDNQYENNNINPLYFDHNQPDNFYNNYVYPQVEVNNKIEDYDYFGNADPHQVIEQEETQYLGEQYFSILNQEQQLQQQQQINSIKKEDSMYFPDNKEKSVQQEIEDNNQSLKQIKQEMQEIKQEIKQNQYNNQQQIQNQEKYQIYISRNEVVVKQEIGENEKQEVIPIYKFPSKEIEQKVDQQLAELLKFYNNAQYNMKPSFYYKPDSKLILENIDKFYLGQSIQNIIKSQDITILKRKKDSVQNRNLSDIISNSVLPDKISQQQEKQIKQQQSLTTNQCQNMKKLIMVGILKYFSPSIIQQATIIPQPVKDDIIRITNLLRESGKVEQKKKIVKMDNFSQPHFNVLFLTLNRYSCTCMCKNEQNVYLHKQVFNTNISKYKAIDEEKLEYINLIKQFMYLIAKQFLEKKIEEDSEVVKGYKERVVVSIKKMIEGQYIKKFQIYQKDLEQNSDTKNGSNVDRKNTKQQIDQGKKQKKQSNNNKIQYCTRRSKKN